MVISNMMKALKGNMLDSFIISLRTHPKKYNTAYVGLCFAL